MAGFLFFFPFFFGTLHPLTCSCFLFLACSFRLNISRDYLVLFDKEREGDAGSYNYYLLAFWLLGVMIQWS